MPRTRVNPDPPELPATPGDDRDFIRRLEEDGMTVWPSTAGPATPLPEPLRLNTSLSEAIIEERDEYYA